MDKDVRSQIEKKIQKLKKRLEGVLKISTNTVQQKRVSIELARLKKDFKKLQEDNFTESDIKKYLSPDEIDTYSSDNDSPKERLSDYEILSKIKIEPASIYCNEIEINEIFSFIVYFEKELWGTISDYQLKLDFNYSRKRDEFYHNLNVLQIAIKNYQDILQDLAGNSMTKEYEEKLKKMKTKQYMTLLLKSGDFIKELHSFIYEILQDYRNGGNIILNPEDELHFNELHGEKLLEGVNVIVAVEKLFKFLTEFLEYLNIPELKSYNYIEDGFNDE